MTKRIYLGIDFFQASAFYGATLNPELETDEGQHFYVVLQPFLIHNTTVEDPDFPGEKVESPDLKEYLTQWTGENFAGGGRAVVVRGELRDRLEKVKIDNPNNPEKWPVFTPVTFPPGTLLKFKLTWSGGGTADFERTIGGASPTAPFISSARDWPEFAARNYVGIVIRRYEDLNERQQRDVLDWTYDLALALSEKKVKGTKLTEVEEKIFESYFKSPPSPGTVKGRDEWHAYLNAGAPPTVSKIFTELWKHFAEGKLTGEPHLIPPRFKYMPSELKKVNDLPDAEINQAVERLFGKVYKSYHESLWDTLGKLFQQGKDEARVREEIRAAFGRLFGFGERLRWPRPTDADRKHFMIVARDDQNEKDKQGRTWLITNAHSLAGQVFRIGAIAPDADIAHFEIEELSLQDKELFKTEKDEDEFEKAMNFVRQDMRALAAVKTIFASDIKREPIEAKVQFLPKNALAQEMKLRTPANTKLKNIPTGKHIYSVPGALLDELENSARVEFPPGDWRGWQPPQRPAEMVRLTPPCILLDPKSDLYGAKADEDQTYQARIWEQYQALIQVKASLERIPLAPPHKPEAHAYRLSLIGQLHERDLAAIKKCLSAADLTGLIEIWLPKVGADSTDIVAYPLPGKDVWKREEMDGRPVLTLSDPEGKLTALLPTIAAGDDGTKRDPQLSVVVDLICVVEEGKDLFNWLVYTGAGEKPLAPPLLFMHDDFTFRVNFSVEQIIENFKLSPAISQLPPKPADNRDEPLLGHFSNFNKLRLWLQKKSSQKPPTADAEAVPLNHPDALIPWGESVMSVGVPPRPFLNFHYSLAHLFSEQVRDTAIEAESARYRLYRSAGDELKFTGNIEHQYGYQIPAASSETHRLRVATDIRHPASLEFSNDLKKVEGGLHAISFDHVPGTQAAPEDEWIKVKLKKSYFQEAVRQYKQEEVPSGKAPNADQVRPARLRQLYEALSDWVAQDGAATLHLERWNFDNRLKMIEAREAGDPEAAMTFPALTSNLNFVESGMADLRKDKYLEHVRTLLGTSFEQFVDNLMKAVEKADHPLWKEFVRINLKEKDKQWAWPQKLAGRYPIYRTTDVVRLGLKIRRATGRTIAADDYYKTAAPLPLEPEKDANGAPVLALPNLVPLSDEARTEFNKYLTVPPADTQDIYASPLHQSFAWLISEDEDKKDDSGQDDPSNPMNQYDEERREKLFGELLPHLNFPTGMRGQLPTVVDLYYVLYAFRPLLAHPAFRDPQTTSEFVGYLLLILDDLISGRPLTRVGVAEEGVAPEVALGYKEMAERFLKHGITQDGKEIEGIAPRLARFVERVDNVSDTITKDPLFAKVQKHVEEIDKRGWREAALVSLFAARPSVYVTNKAIGVCIFAQETFSERIHSLQLTKQIRREAAKSDAMLKMTDTDRFVFKKFLGDADPAKPLEQKDLRFLLDVLDDASYDNDFEIAQNEYKTEQPPGTSRRADGIKTRGTTLARSAEDLIEQKHYFENPQPEPRTIEANVVHYNPHWQGKYYLPSRRVPVIPKPVSPLDKASWITSPRLSIPATGKVVLSDLFKELLDKLPDKISLNVASGVKPLEFNALIGTQAAPAKDSVGEAVNLENCGPWYNIESYFSHSFFIVEPDEEGDDNPFSNDIFEIEVETSDLPFAPIPPSIATEETKMISKLQNWFFYDRARKQGEPKGDKEEAAGTKKNEPPANIALVDILEEIKLWFLTPEKAEQQKVPTGGVGMELLRASNPQDKEIKTHLSGELRKFRYFRDRGSVAVRWHLLRWAEAGEAKKPAGIGEVIAAEMFEFAGEGAKKGKMFLLRVTVLDQPWKYTRARARLLRNVALINEDDVSDINPVFAMTTRHSDWVNYGRHMPQLGYVPQLELDNLPEPARHLLVEPVGQIPSFETWENQPTHDDQAKDFGPLVMQMMKKTFETDKGPKRLWNLDEAVHGKLQVTGTVLQIITDQHPRQSQPNATTKLIPARGDMLAKQHLEAVSANEIGSLTRKMRKDLIRTSSPYLKVNWSNKEGNGMGDRLLEIIWPVSWKS